MFKNFRDRIVLSGFSVLGIGIALLVFTFISAYGFLTASLEIIATEDLVQTFGEALAPLIATCIRIMYLGVMGWIGSLITIRGVTIIANAPKVETAVPKKVEPAKEEKLEAKSAEPEFVVMPLDEIEQPQPQSQSQSQSQPSRSSS
ncbi:MAG: hypothetical protein ACUVUE_03200 [Candidatus Bathycorpusculaceae bacterium]